MSYVYLLNEMGGEGLKGGGAIAHAYENPSPPATQPAHQPENIGYRKAWSSGGCEWNWSPGKIGHSVFTEAPTYTAVIETAKGPVVRVWEYDRQNHTVWSVDMLFDDEEEQSGHSNHYHK